MRGIKKWIPVLILTLLIGTVSFASDVQDGGEPEVSAESGISVNADAEAQSQEDNLEASGAAEEESGTEQTADTVSITVSDVDVQAGTFRVEVDGLADLTTVKTVWVPVWSETGGQDDLIWYSARKDASGIYYVDVNIKNHKYTPGKYLIHVYVDETGGNRYFAGKTECALDQVKGDLEITTKNGKDYTLSLSGFSAPGGAQAVLFPVWSKTNGQDDIRWYQAKKDKNGTWTANISVSAHKGLGEYLVHTYAQMPDGSRRFIQSESFEVKLPDADEISVEKLDVDAGTFRVRAAGLDGSGLLKSVKIAVWSETNGQDDLIWYDAKKDDKGNYYVDVNIKKHKYTSGKYFAHVYGVAVTGDMGFVGKTEAELPRTPGELKAVTENEKDYTITLTGFQTPGGAQAVLFPVWSKVNGQDDIRWYQAEKAQDGTWTAKVSLTDHKGLGYYYVHAYAKLPDGSLQGIGNTGFETKAPSVGTISAEVSDRSAGKFCVSIAGIENGNLIKQIQVPVWSAADQSDIVWYTAVKCANGTYVVNTDISKHKYNCKEYKVHVYLTDVTGARYYVGSTSCDLRPSYESLTVSDSDGKEMYYEMELTGLQVPSGEQKVMLAVWGESGGQNDLRWYTADKASDGSYRYRIAVSNHKELGGYKVHVYCQTRGGQMQFIGSDTFEVSSKPTALPIEISEINGTAGTFRVTVSGLAAKSGISKVRIPVWCSSDQSDIRWYDALKTSEGTYTVVVKAANHKHHFGNYRIHLYATMGNGIQTFVSSTSAGLQPKNYVYCVAKSSTREEVVALGVSGSRVQFPTWSNANGQDDIIWYEGTNCGNGKWNAVVDSGKHASGGTYTTHVYVTANGNRSNIGALSYSLQRVPQAVYSMWLKANMYSSSTGYIALVSRATHKVAIFQGYQGNWNCVKFWDCADGKASTPTVTGVFKVGSRGYYFNSGSYRCYWWTQFYHDYLFHSVLYNWSGVLVDGRVGMGLSHGCVRLQIDNAKWIYDHIPSGTTVVVY